jgi:serine/threonine protein kinase
MIYNQSDFQTVKNLSKTFFSVVDLVRDRETNALYCVKRISIAKGKSPAHASVFLFREVFTQLFCQCEATLPLLKFGLHSDSETSFALVSPYMPHGNLCSKISAWASRGPLQKSIIAFGSIFAIARLHSLRVHHRDIKPENLLLDSNFEPKLCDLGLATLKERAESDHSGQVGTEPYCAPEIFNSLKYTMKTDIFGWAFILYTLAQEVIPRYPDGPGNFGWKINKNQRPLLDRKIADSNVGRLVSQCWAMDPDERPSAAEIVEGFKRGEYLFKGTDKHKFDEYVRRLENDAFQRDLLLVHHDAPLDFATLCSLFADDGVTRWSALQTGLKTDSLSKMVGTMYWKGLRVQENMFLAMKLLNQSVPIDGDIVKSVEMEINGDLMGAFAGLKSAAGRGSLDALVAFGEFLIRHGKENEGYRILDVAASKGNAEAMWVVGLKRGDANGRALVAMAAEKGHRDAAASLDIWPEPSLSQL